MPDDLTTLSAGEAVSAMRDGRMTALAYAEALLARCAAGADLNAFIALDPDAVRAAARAADARRAAGEPLGPLHGLPVPVKDSIATADLPTTAGTTALRDFRPAHDAGIVARLRAAGASVLGKTNLHELSMGWSSNNQAFGAVRNPWDRTRIPGGSSGGTAAAVAAGMAPLGLAEDTQGSIRVPAALCGIAGFRPTTGRYPSDGCAPISPLFDQIGPHARCVADLALFDAVITGEDAPLDPVLLDGLRLNGLRLGIVRDYYFDGIDPAVAAVVETALERLADAGVTLVETEFPGLGTLIAAITSAVQAHDVVPSLTAWLEAMGAPVGFDAMFAQVSPDVATLLRQIALPGAPHATSEAAYAAARDVHRPALQAQFAQWFTDNRVDAMVLPATMTTATPIGQDDHLHIAGRDVPFRFAMGRNIAPGSTAGLPGLVLPAGLANGLPVAIELDGPAGSDRAILAMGLAIEGVLGTLPLR
eukprot:gene6093-6168_t